MKIELTIDQKKQVEAAVENNNVHKWLSIKDSIKFEVGDILIKKNKSYYGSDKGSWCIENLPGNAKMAQRYVYVHEDEFGIGFIKRLRLSDGALGKELWCLTEFDCDDTRFEVDPEYAEHVLLDAEFNIKEIHKKSLESRKIATKMNRKSGKKPQTLKEFNDFFDQLNVGDTFWTSYNFTGEGAKEYLLVNIVKTTVAQVNKERAWVWDNWSKSDNGKVIDAETVYKIQYNAISGLHNVVEILRGYILYTQKPAQEEK